MARIVAFLLLLLSGAAYAGPLDQPTLLVASPDMQGPYAQTVLIAVPVGDEHLGFILNRATGVKLASLLVFAVVRRNPGAEALRLVGDAFLVTDAQSVDRIIERTPNDARYFAGFVGWRPGELAKEIDAGYWHVTDADPALFWRENTHLWRELVEHLSNGHAPQRGRGFQSASL